MLPTFTYIKPTTLDQAVRELATPGARACSGGTDLLGCLRDRVFTAEKLVSLNGLTELRGVTELANGGLRIGALTTLTEVATHALIGAKYQVLAAAAAAAASPQLRNQGTIGGNICQRPRCWYYRGDFACARKGGDICFAKEGENQLHAIFGGDVCVMVHPSDTAPALMALDASVRLVGPRGTRTVPMGEFFVLPSKDHTRETVVEPGELVTELVLPPPPALAVSTYRKLRARGAWDFAITGAAVALGLRGKKIESARVVLSGVAPVPWRVEAAEKELVGHELSDALIERAAQRASANATPLSGNAYKVALVRGAVAEALSDLRDKG
ncbi:MAG: xanthine dehydrogenase family protein subunit M [Gemmatimonadota bacterium]|nr:xanthine dehydrogenase family protein subunit M [Gemmatimonadota bacterium]